MWHGTMHLGGFLQILYIKVERQVTTNEKWLICEVIKISIIDKGGAKFWLFLRLLNVKKFPLQQPHLFRP